MICILFEFIFVDVEYEYECNKRCTKGLVGS